MQRYRFSIEHTLYLVILVLALFLRFVSLGQNPLDPRESVYALQSLAISQGEQITITGEPGYVVFTAALFSLFQADEFSARFWPALFGSSLVLVPFLFQRIIGKKTSLLLSLFLAIDPILVAQSRAAGGSMFALLGLSAGFGFLINRKPLPSGIFFGLAILGGVNLWLGLLAILIFGLILIKKARLFLAKDFYPEWTRQETGKFLLSLGAMLVSLGTIFMLIPQGISAIGSGLVEYIASWSGEDGLRLPHVLIVWSLTYLPILLVGLWGFITCKREELGGRLAILASLVFAWLIAVLNPQLAMENLAWSSIPLWLLGALMVKDFICSLVVKQRIVWVSMTALFIVMWGFSFTNLNNLFYEISPSPEIIQGRLIGVLLPFVLLVLVSVLVSWSWSKKDTFNGILTGILIVLMMSIPGSTWRATGMTNQKANELWHSIGFPVGASGLEESLNTYGKWASGQATGVDILVSGVEDPSLRWALRNYKQVEDSTINDPEYKPVVVITDLDDTIQSASIYRGQELTWLVSPNLDQMGVRDWVRWRLFRQAPAVESSYLLWVRNDIFPGGSSQ